MMTECYTTNVSPLDRILEEGFKRIDEAVEGVIGKYPTPVFKTLDDFLGKNWKAKGLGDIGFMEQLFAIEDYIAHKKHNKNLLNMVVDNATMSHNPAFGGTNL